MRGMSMGSSLCIAAIGAVIGCSGEQEVTPVAVAQAVAEGAAPAVRPAAAHPPTASQAPPVVSPRVLAWVGELHGALFNDERLRGVHSPAGVTSVSYMRREAQLSNRAIHGVVVFDDPVGQVELYDDHLPAALAGMERAQRADKLAFELAHEKAAAVRWDGVQPEVAVYDQRSKEQLWSAVVDATGHKEPLRIAWHPGGELTVEWRGAAGYERIVYHGTTGAVIRRESLDPRVEAAVADPIGYLMEAPSSSSQTVKTSAGELIVTSSPLAPQLSSMRDVVTGQPLWLIGTLCGDSQIYPLVIRAAELDDQRIMLVEANYFYGFRGALGTAHDLRRDNANCSSVRIIQLSSQQVHGVWMGDQRVCAADGCEGIEY